MGQGYKAKPQGADALVERINDLQRQIDQLRARAGIRNAVISGGKGLRITDSEGNTIATFGTVDGEPGFALQRPDGTPIMSYAQGLPWRVYDAAGDEMMATDENSGHGLATPYIGAPLLAPGDTSKWAATTAGSFTQQFRGTFVKQHPQLFVSVWAVADSGAAGEVRVKWGGTTSAAQAVTTSFDTLEFLFPIATGEHLEVGDIVIEARRTSGSGSPTPAVKCIPLAVYGIQST